MRYDKEALKSRSENCRKNERFARISGGNWSKMTSLKYKASFCKKKGTNNGYYCDKEGENGHIEEEDVTS